MRPHIVVGYDGGPGSRDALALALVLLDGEPERSSELTVVSASAADLYGLHPTRSHAVYERELAERSQAQLESARETVGDRPSVSFVVQSDRSPARALHLLAEEFAASAIVVGRSHAGLVGRAFPGSVTEQTLHGAPCPVYVAPVGYATRRGGRLDAIAVAFDGSPTSLGALEFGARLAARNGATLRLIRVLEPPLVPYGGSDAEDECFEDRRAAALPDLRHACAHLDGPPPELSVLVGDPVELLSAPGAEVDLLVAGSRGFGPAEAVLLGGISSKLARDCRVALVVVPRAP